ncbi:MAG: M14-type cytosolic carboxypeptidase, partial [Persicimonas sp.]
HRVAYSYDREDWRFFDNNEYLEGEGELRFSNNAPFREPEVYVAFGVPYTTDDVRQLAADMKASPFVAPTDSADEDLVIGQSPGGDDELGRSFEARDIYGFKITDPDANGPRAKIVLSGGIHANESTGNHVLEGLVRWLVSDDVAASGLREAAEFYVYPMVNPDGYAAGLDRGTLARPQTDANRYFASDVWDGHDEVALVGEAMASDTGGQIDYLLDFQLAVGAGLTYAYLDADGDPTGVEMRYDPFWEALTDYAQVEGRDASLDYDTAMKFGWSELGADFAATFEPYYQPGWDAVRYGRLGESIGRAFALARGSFGDVELDMNFDSGSIDLANTTIDGDTVALAGRDNYNSGSWKWVYFRARNVAGRQLDFELGDNFASGSDKLTDHKFVYSYDGQTWHFFDNGDLSGGKYRFSNDTAFSQNEVFISYGLPYPYEEAVDLVAAASGSQWVSPTTSADSDLVIGQTAGGTDDLGRDIGPHDLFGFEITDTSAGGPKTKVVLVGGVHANETNGSHTLHGLVEWLLGSSNEAAALRREAVFYVYPMVNADGRYAGYNRGTVETPAEDPNRQWSSDDWDDNTEIRRTAQAILADTGGEADYLIDFHSFVGTGQHFCFLDKDASPTGIDMDEATFWQELTAREPLESRDATYDGHTAMRLAWSELGADFAATLETYFRPGENIDRYRGPGENVGVSLYEAVVP